MSIHRRFNPWALHHRFVGDAAAVTPKGTDVFGNSSTPDASGVSPAETFTNHANFAGGVALGLVVGAVTAMVLTSSNRKYD